MGHLFGQRVDLDAVQLLQEKKLEGHKCFASTSVILTLEAKHCEVLRLPSAQAPVISVNCIADRKGG